MNYKILIVSLIILGTSFTEIFSQGTDANIFGDVVSEGEHLPFCNVYIKGTNYGTVTDHTGHYMLTNLPPGKHILVAQMLGYITNEQEITVEYDRSIEVNFELKESNIALEQVVVTGTRTTKKITEAPIMVNVLDSKTLNFTQSNTVSEGLCFQPGLRVEVDCQTCNYTQLRMNGMGGSYSQILINNQPVFSALNGLYGLEQIPANMIERIEVVRGGGSALYGSSAIAGTVNIITKTPEKCSYQVSVNQSFINSEASDNILNGNISTVNQRQNAGLSVFASSRNREEYDHNDDGFSELPRLRNNSFGLNMFYRPNYRSRLEVNLFSIYEDRRGGNNFADPPHKADQAEDRTHNVLVGGIQYETKFKNDLTKMNIYVSGQDTKRKHYTGIDGQDGYGTTQGNTLIGGIQADHLVKNFPGGANNLTVGTEYHYDDIYDEIPAYNYLIDQTAKQVGLFAQSDWQITSWLNTLVGMRADKHNLVDKIIFNPRASLLVNAIKNTQFRASFSTGFRAPQAFDADMHIAFSGGGIAFINLAPDLVEETSRSVSLSATYDRAATNYIYGFTLEGFYTRLNDAFVLEEVGTDSVGNTILEKRNGSSSTVQGITIELRGNLRQKYQLETGITIQKSQFDDPVEWSADIPGTRDFLRSPGSYGYYTLTLTPIEKLNFSISGVYTGTMKVPHFAGASGVDEDILFTSPNFFETNLRISYTFSILDIRQNIELYGGVQNLFNQFQDDFDTGKNRDSGYIYGPARPRTIFIGLKFGDIL